MAQGPQLGGWAEDGVLQKIGLGLPELGQRVLQRLVERSGALVRRTRLGELHQQRHRGTALREGGRAARGRDRGAAAMAGPDIISKAVRGRAEAALQGDQQARHGCRIRGHQQRGRAVRRGRNASSTTASVTRPKTPPVPMKRCFQSSPELSLRRPGRRHERAPRRSGSTHAQAQRAAAHVAVAQEARAAGCWWRPSRRSSGPPRDRSADAFPLGARRAAFTSERRMPAGTVAVRSITSTTISPRRRSVEMIACRPEASGTEPAHQPRVPRPAAPGAPGRGHSARWRRRPPPCRGGRSTKAALPRSPPGLPSRRARGRRGR